MSLLDNASLLLTPNAYKEGKLYSVIPSNGNGDFTATRATTATRVDSAGLVDLVPYNLLQYSEMLSNAAWTKTAASVTANTTTAPDGTLTADSFIEDNTTAAHQTIQTSLSSAGGVYTSSIYLKPNGRSWAFINITAAANYGAWFDVQNGVVGTIQANITTATITSVGNGWYRCTLTANTGALNPRISLNLSTGNNVSSYTGNGTSGIFIWGAQLVEGTSARDYLRTETRLNIPRIDYSLGGCPNILLEPQRTNLALQSSSFDNASWLKTSTTVTANSSISPSGVSDSDTLNITTSSGFIRQTGNIASATNYTYSAYVKKSANTANNLFRLYYNNNIGSPNNGEFRAVVDLTNLTITTTPLGTLTTGRPTILSSTLTDVGNGWYRASVAFTTGTLAGNTSAEIGFQANTTAVEFLAWGAQLEAGAYATSFIPTTTASVTRNADSITRNNIFTNGLITAAGGTWFVELKNNRVYTRDSSANGLSLNSVSGGNFQIRAGAASARILILKTDLGVNSIIYTTLTDTVKIAIKWNGSTADVFVNGVKVVSATAFNTTLLQELAATGGDVPKYINEMALFPTPLTDAQCLALTA